MEDLLVIFCKLNIHSLPVLPGSLDKTEGVVWLSKLRVNEEREPALAGIEQKKCGCSNCFTAIVF